MNKKLKIFLFLLTISLSFFVSILFWKNLSLDLNNYDNVIGFYSENNISNYNNLLRFIFFTGFPILTFFILIKKIFYDNVGFINIFKNKLIDEQKENKVLVLI